MKVKFIGHYYGHVLQDKVNRFMADLKGAGYRVVNIEYSTQKTGGDVLSSALVTYEEAE